MNSGDQFQRAHDLYKTGSCPGAADIYKGGQW